MKIAVDIDCTMNQFLFEYIYHCKKLCDIYNHKYTLNLSAYYIKDQFQLTDRIYDVFMKNYFPVSVRNSNLMPGCKKVLQELSICDNIQLFCMTSRDAEYNKGYNCYTGKQMKKDTLEWFKTNQLPFDETNTYFSIKNKGAKCKELGIDILIDDNPKHIQECIDNGIICYFPIYEYNKHFIGYKNVIPLYNGWIDVLKVKMFI